MESSVETAESLVLAVYGPTVVATPQLDGILSKGLILLLTHQSLLDLHLKLSMGGFTFWL